ncbi:uncharacterized protein LOC132795181 [Drosophila nasuta]|uniref:uncharacterized protein LOC132795181 n=1 Tax=Drosophila nasuta TaxID=42062 RepID=UPI00295F3AB7|nr:uncharacterized protein LOC132795181 [Drosophila nasuta]
MAYCSLTGSPQRFANCLSNFPLQDLLILKKSVQLMRSAEEDELSPDDSGSCNDTPNAPQRMALMAAERGDHSGPSQPWQQSGGHMSSWTEEKPSKLQTLFQISITALAFLSFGGYLLCLIVQAIKSKGTTYFHPVATATTTSSNGNVKRIKIYRRSKRSPGAANDVSNLLLPDYASYMKSIRERRSRYAHLVGS